jgi:hypothetical protein
LWLTCAWSPVSDWWSIIVLKESEVLVHLCWRMYSRLRISDASGPKFSSDICDNPIYPKGIVWSQSYPDQKMDLAVLYCTGFTALM